MNKVCINACYGGFSLSEMAVSELCERKGVADRDDFYQCDLDRHDPDLIEVVERLGDAANGDCACLQVVTISGDRYRIEEYDGSETLKTPDSPQRWTVIS